MGARRRTIGFDRKIQLDWLDATAAWAGQGLAAGDIRLHLDRLLEGKVASGGDRSARDKTRTVLMHVWVDVPRALEALRDEGLALYQSRGARVRLPLHWGMCLATYPFFRDIAGTAGRLLELQGTVALSQVTRRVAETWGERSTVIRATQRVIRSLVLWEVLRETDERGVFAPTRRMEVASDEGLGPWLVEAALSGSDHQGRPLRSLLSSPTFFPFELQVSRRDLAKHPRLELHRQGLDEEMVTRSS